MAEYVEHVNYCKNVYLCPEDMCEKEKCPYWCTSTADVEFVRCGIWVYGEYDIPHCSECGHEIMPNQVLPYCPNCGAQMDGEEWSNMDVCADFFVHQQPTAISFDCPYCNCEVEIPWDELNAPDYWGDDWGYVDCPQCNRAVHLGEVL